MSINSRRLNRLFLENKKNIQKLIIFNFRNYTQNLFNNAELTKNTRFVPKCKEISDLELAKINDFIKNTKNLFVLSGAGLSTESGLRDYRSEGVGLYAVSSHRPMQYSDFLSASNKRKIYWARNYVSWPIFSSFKPNISHMLLSKWESAGKVYHHVTQNVDSLLVKAGCRKLTELHGTSYKVQCIDCNFRLSRDAMQLLIKAENPNWSVVEFEEGPDNDVKLTDEQIKDFKLPKCPNCKNDKLKPEIGI